MKKILILLIFVLSFSILSPISGQAYSNEKVDSKDYKEMMKSVKEAVLEGKEDAEIENLNEVQKFKNTYSEEAIIEFVNNTEVFQNLEESGNSNDGLIINNSVSDVQEKLTEFEDGSFKITTAKIQEIPSNNEIDTLNTLSPRMLYSNDTEYFDGKAGSKFEYDYGEAYWGLWKVAELHLITNFTLVNRNKVTITSTDHAGTKAYAPSTVDNVNTNIVKNNAVEVQSKGSYRKTNGIAIEGLPLGSTRYITLTTTIRIHGDDSQNNLHYYVKTNLKE